MFARLLLSLLLGFIFSTAGLVILPDLGRLAGPLICAGTLEPEERRSGLRYRCIAAGDGRIEPVPTDRVVLATLPVLAALLLVPVSVLVARYEQRARRAAHEIQADLSRAVVARAEVLEVARHGNLKRQILMRVAELQLLLWVQPPNGRPYEARVAWLVEEANMRELRPGAVIPVRLNPDRPARIYPAAPWAYVAFDSGERNG